MSLFSLLFKEIQNNHEFNSSVDQKGSLSPVYTFHVVTKQKSNISPKILLVEADDFVNI